jgi:hypothetical protein
MSVFTVTHVTRVDGYGVVQTLEPTDAAVGQSVTVAGLTNSSLNGSFTVVSTESYALTEVTPEGDLVFDYDFYYPNQIIFADAGDDIARTADSGTVTYGLTCTWIDSDDVIEWLGIESATANDTAFIATCVSAANAFCYRRRQAAGYFDSLSTVPDASVKLGTVMYAAYQYRTRGSVDGYASFESMATGTTTIGFGQIMQLLGTGRPQVG